MKPQIHSETQGSEEWLAGRRTRLNASELVLAAGINMNGRTRTGLIRRMATGIEEEIDPHQQKRFDDGHSFEALALPLAEQILGRALYPITLSAEVDGLKRRLGVSLDGATDDDDINYEHKGLNQELEAAMEQGIIPDEYHWQMEQGQMLNGARRTLFMASKWDDDDNLIKELHLWYNGNPDLRAKIIPIWKQAEADAEAYQHVEAAPVATAAPINELPALMVEITGSVTASNLADWKAIVTERIAGINTDLQTDTDFANADAMVKFLDDGEKRIDLVKSQAQANAADIDRVFRALDEIKASMRAKRLELDKLVTKRKESIKFEIMQAGKDALAAHIAMLDKRIGEGRILPPQADFATAIKGKRNLESMRGAVADLVAAKKIEANEIADKVQINLASLNDAKEYTFLFSDRSTLAMKAPDDLALVIKSRIADHLSAEAKREEETRQRIRIEEETRAAAKAKAEQEARDKIAAENLAAEKEFSARIAAEAEANRAKRTEPAPLPAPAESNGGRLEETAGVAAHKGITGSARLMDRLDDLARRMTERELSDLCIHAEHILESRKVAA